MNQETVDQLKAKVEQDKAILAFDQILLDLATKGWQTDQDAQTKAVADAVAPLNTQITTLTASVEAVKNAINPVPQS